MSILKWDNYIFDSYINESQLFFGKDLRDKLLIVDNKISKDLLSKEFTDIKPDTTFLKLEDDGYISYIRLKEAEKLINPDWSFKSFDNLNKNLLDVIHSLDKNGPKTGIFSGDKRNKIKIGRLINSIFPNKYTPREIEEFTNSIKSKIETEEQFELVQGDDIAYWYKEENYLTLEGNLGNSCMRKKSEDIFEIYTRNSDVCQMLILKNIKSNKIIGRALVWKINIKNSDVDKNIKWLMDRIYSINDIITDKFREYASSKGWAYKTINNFSSINNITYLKEEYYVNMTVQLEKTKYLNYPYMDTFKGFNKKNFQLENIPEKIRGYLFLEEQDGGYEDGDISLVYSDWYGTEIEEERAIWSVPLNDYLFIDRSVKITLSSRDILKGWYPDNYDYIDYDEIRGEYIHSDDSFYSDYYGFSIFQDDVIECITDVDIVNNNIYKDINYLSSEDSSVIDEWKLSKSEWYKKIDDDYPEFNNYYISSNILDLDYEKNFILNKGDICIVTYKYGKDWLLKIDSYLLGNKIEQKVRSVNRIEDKFKYLKRIEKYNIKSICEKELIRINNILNNKQGLLDVVGDIDEYKSELSSLKSEIEKRIDFEINLVNDFKYN